MIDSSILQGKKIVYYTLGCKLNFAETSSLGNELKRHGAVTVRKGEVADIVIVNTCSVTEVADQKCRQAIRRLSKQHPGAFVVVTGCYAQLKPSEVSAIKDVNLIVGIKNKGNIINMIMQCLSEGTGEVHTDVSDSNERDIPFAPSCSHGDRTRYFLKVQDGCNYFCTYCTIPMARGRSRNGSIESLVAQARQVAAEGGREIVITGVNIGDFGKTTGETFLQLIQQLDQVEGIERYRISSIEPNLLTDEIIEFCAKSKRFMPHFHIPLQCGSDTVLKLMHRHYDTELFRSKIERIHSLIPDCFIGVDVIVGTRGETKELFEESYNFIRSLNISQLHVFSYSERPGTQALKIPHIVTPEEKHERSQRLLALSDEKLRSFYQSQIGKKRPVLFEHSMATKPKMCGFTDNYVRIEVPNNPEHYNTIQEVTISDKCINLQS